MLLQVYCYLFEFIFIKQIELKKKICFLNSNEKKKIKHDYHKSFLK